MGRIPWNKGKIVGDKLPFTQGEVHAVKAGLRKLNDVRGLAFFSLAVDSSLRQGDFIKLKGLDVRAPNGMIYQEATIQMEKTKKRVTFVIFDDTREFLLEYMAASHIKDEDYLFPGRFAGRPICKATFRRFVKRCAEMIGLNPFHYSGHSTRRTRLFFLIREKVQDVIIAELLGVSVKTIQHYARRSALQISKEHPM